MKFKRIPFAFFLLLLPLLGLAPQAYAQTCGGNQFGNCPDPLKEDCEAIVKSNNPAFNRYACTPKPGPITQTQEPPTICYNNTYACGGICCPATTSCNISSEGVSSCDALPSPRPRTTTTATVAPQAPPTTDCSMSSEKPGGCSCTSPSQCASNVCNTPSRRGSGTCATPAGSTTAPATTNQACSLKSQGDANCDGKVNISDFGIWKDELVAELTTNLQANFNGDAGPVNISDFGIWKDGLINPAIPH